MLVRKLCSLARTIDSRMKSPPYRCFSLIHQSVSTPILYLNSINHEAPHHNPHRRRTLRPPIYGGLELLAQI
ncbi:hypothetical protein Vi05172_g11836 [Venturia inaequalis]|nr:hypothetical protein Vi05172_g11836 [Venturia inaequalis]